MTARHVAIAAAVGGVAGVVGSLGFGFTIIAVNTARQNRKTVAKTQRPSGLSVVRGDAS